VLVSFQPEGDRQNLTEERQSPPEKAHIVPDITVDIVVFRQARFADAFHSRLDSLITKNSLENLTQIRDEIYMHETR
jgi:hypothetical protein